MEGAELLWLSSDLRVRVRAGREIELEALARAGETLADVSRRVCGRAEPLGLAPEGWVPVPMALVSDEMRALVLLHLFPEDRRDGEDWLHVARSGPLPTYGAGLWQVSAWFTGSGENFPRLMETNGLRFPELSPGQVIRIPGSLLHAAFRRPRSDDGSLEFASDERGPYAGYRLRAGEALYSAVVVRFTGRDSPEDVTRLAQELSTRSGIRDVTDIPVGYLIRIPLDLLEPEFLPKDHPRRREAESLRAEMARELARQPVASTRGGLKGVVVVLDPGHGGRDLGTMSNGIWEHDYVYDVTCRLKQRLERESAATVVLTLEDAHTGSVPSTGDALRANQQGTIQTTPPFLAREDGEAEIGVNLRWYLANSVYRRAVSNGGTPDRVVFLSLHADSRHAALRGAMVYVPGARYRKDSYSQTGKVYRRYQEVREQPEARFSHRDRVRSEAVSRKLADAILRAFRDRALPVQAHRPVRDRVVRGRRAWVPAVIRANAIPAKVLVELVNLSNPLDAKLLGAAGERERLADALFASLFHHFNEPVPASVEARRAAR
jgi:N-acetylmuramoyl-L-alanine amidase